MPKLVIPKIEYMPSFVANLREQTKADLPIITDEEIDEIEKNPEDYLQKCLDPIPEPGHIPGIKLWYVEGNEFIGRINIRPKLNDDFMIFGGNIGYFITVRHQGKGYGTNMLKAALIYCKENLPLEKVLITCAEANIASIKVIEKNGGILENTLIHPATGRLTRRYWITL